MNQDIDSNASFADQSTTIEEILDRSGLTFLSELASPSTLKTTEDGDWVFK